MQDEHYDIRYQNMMHISVSVQFESPCVILLGYWLKEQNIKGQLVDIAKSIPLSDLCESLQDDHLGLQLIEHGDLMSRFEQFVSSSELGKFILSVIDYRPQSPYLASRFLRDRMALDLGRALKATDWFLLNKPEFVRQRKSIKTIKKVMEQ